MKYRIKFQFRVDGSKWFEDYIDNNGKGFDFDEAEYIACELYADSVVEHRWIEVEEM